MSARAQLNWGVPPAVLARNLGVSVQKMAARMRMEMQRAASQMQSFARSAHPWANRTGAAEASFTVKAAGLVITVAHGVYYGIYLEYKHGGKWGVIPKVMEYGSGPIRAGMMAALKEL